MMKIVKITNVVLFLLFAFPLMAQENESLEQEYVIDYAHIMQDYTPPEYEPYDPLIPQMFSFDKQHGIFAGINNIENKIVIVSHQGNDTLFISHEYLVDKIVGRHDTHHIYRPKSVAIYDGYVAFLASHRDSCYFAVLDMNGNLVKMLKFSGFASAFSYSPSSNELYISGENDTGFDVIVLDTSFGINNVDIKSPLKLHYQKPRMSEIIAKRDPYGIGMAAIAMSVVFLALLMLFLVFKQIGMQMIAIRIRRTKRQIHKQIEIKKEAALWNASVKNDEFAVFAAIAAAIHLYGEELHDVENTVLTINKVSRTYSPWSSKIHGLNSYYKR